MAFELFGIPNEVKNEQKTTTHLSGQTYLRHHTV